MLTGKRTSIRPLVMSLSAEFQRCCDLTVAEIALKVFSPLPPHSHPHCPLHNQNALRNIWALPKPVWLSG